MTRIQRLSAILLMFIAGASLAYGQADPFARDPLPEGWYARIETSLGEMLIFLHPEQAPQSVAHFAALANAELAWTDRVSGETKTSHYYDGLIVHRAKTALRFEAGDPAGTGNGSPKLYVPPEVDRPMKFDQPYRMGLTRASLNRISGAQFFISVSPEPYLNGRHPCIGTVVRGKTVAKQIASTRTYSNGRPVEPVILNKVRVFKSGDPQPIPEPVPYDVVPEKLTPKADPRSPSR